MARGLNKVMIIGNLGAAPELRHTPSGSAVANVTVATTASWRDKATGEMVERTEWHRVVFFNRLAEIVGEYLSKGSKIYVEGSLKTRKWTDKNEVERYTTEIVANEMQMLDSRGAGGGAAGGGKARTGAGSAAGTAGTAGAAGAGGSGGAMPDFSDDDIPF